jgi:hypothetical protein
MGGTGRNRSEGWKHAKLDGHDNENRVAGALPSDKNFISDIGSLKLGKRLSGKPKALDIGQAPVKTIFGDFQLPKPDIVLEWCNHVRTNLSVKKSSSGQVWLVTLDRFLETFKFHSGISMNPDAAQALALFIGGKDNLANYKSDFLSALNASRIATPSIYAQELHQNRLSATSISRSFPICWNELMDFFRNNIGLISELAFARGATEAAEMWAEVVIYTLPDGSRSIFSISDIAARSQKANNSMISAGPKNGGTTIILPFGFLQMHKNSMQFHHQLKAIKKLYEAEPTG